VSEQNVELIRRTLDDFVARGEPNWNVLHRDVEVHDHDIMDAGDYRGHAGFGRWLEDWTAAWSEFTLEPKEYLDAGDRVVSVFRMTATGRTSGATVEREDAIVWQVRDDEVVRLDYYNNRAQALEQAGLEP
jgi:ketosteroid isomerase-like protein